MNGRMVAFTMRLEEGVSRRLGHLAIDRGVKKATLIREALDEYLKVKGGK